MPEATVGHDTRGVNGNPPTNGGEVALALAGGGGVFPTSGRYSAKIWALLLGCNEATIRNYVRDLDIPHRMPGREMFIEASDFWAVLPVHRPSDAKAQVGTGRKKRK